MSPETGSDSQTISRLQNSRFILSNIADILQTRMDDCPSTSLFRITPYLVEGALIGLFTFLWLEYAQMGKLYHWLFPAIVSSNIVIFHYLISEIVYKFGIPIKRTLGIFLVVSFASLVASFILVYISGLCGLICQITGSHCPVAWHTSPPAIIGVFFKTIILPWLISVTLLAQGVLKREMAKDLARIKQINDSLVQNKIEFDPPKISSTDESKTKTDSLRVSLKDGIRKIAFSDIYFIAVEDHYCKIVYNGGGEIYQEYVRLSLKEALGKLPANHFIQIHRSYAVNLQHVKQIKKEGQAYQMFIRGSDHFLPASRHRAHIFLPKLQEILN